jgi:hypothetical protein
MISRGARAPPRLQRRNAPRRPFRRRTNSPSNLRSYHMSGRRSAQRGRYQVTALPSLLRRNGKPFRSSVIATPRQPHRASSRYPAPLTPCRLTTLPALPQVARPLRGRAAAIQSPTVCPSFSSLPGNARLRTRGRPEKSGTESPRSRRNPQPERVLSATVHARER